MIEPRLPYLSVCSGIEAASVAWHDLMEPAAFSEIEPFASAVLAHHYPDVPNLGDMTKYKGWKPDRAIDLLVGGTPCQSFSVAGLRGGLDDPRGSLMLVYLALARDLRPRWVVWENVPGVLSSHGGRDFGTFLWALADIGYGWAYRILDAQFFGVPQRRRRVFVVGYLGDWRVAASVLFEPHSLSGNPPPSREAGARVADNLTVGANQYSGFNGEPVEAVARPLRSQSQMAHREDADTLAAQCHGSNFGPMGELRRGNGNVTGGVPFLAHALTAQHTASGRMDPNGETFVTGTLNASGKAAGSATQQDAETDMLVTHALRADGFDASEDGTGCGTPLVFANSAGDTALGLSRPGTPPLTNRHGDPGTVLHGMSVRRLTPRECERLQGFPDDYTLVPYRGKPAKDGPRYRALGNSMAVPVMRWIGRRIVDADGACTHA